MKRLTIWAVAVGVCGALASGLSFAALEPKQAPDRPEESLVEAIGRRTRAKDEVVHSLIRGELSLFRAASRFRDIDAGSAAIQPWRMYYPNATETELSCHQVISYVQAELLDSPDEAEAWVAKLREEMFGLRDHLSAPRPGLVAEPAPSAAQRAFSGQNPETGEGR